MLKSNEAFGLVLCLMLLMPLGAVSLAEDIVYDRGGRRDPFVPLTAPEGGFAASSVSGLRLEGIIYDPQKKSFAILNGKSYQEGESVGEAVVKKIQRNYVLVLMDGEEKELWIHDEEKSQKV